MGIGSRRRNNAQNTQDAVLWYNQIESFWQHWVIISGLQPGGGAPLPTAGTALAELLGAAQARVRTGIERTLVPLLCCGYATHQKDKSCSNDFKKKREKKQG